MSKPLNDLNYLHPFVEGNGRTTRFFINETCRRVGIRFDANLLPAEKIIEAADSYLGTQNNMIPARLIYDELGCYSNGQTFLHRAEAVKKMQPLRIVLLKPDWLKDFLEIKQ